MIETKLSVKTLHKKLLPIALNTSTYFSWVSTITGCVREGLEKYVKTRDAFGLWMNDSIRSLWSHQKGGSLSRTSIILSWCDVEKASPSGISTKDSISTGSGMLWNHHTSTITRFSANITTNRAFARLVTLDGALMLQTIIKDKTRGNGCNFFTNGAGSLLLDVRIRRFFINTFQAHVKKIPIAHVQTLFKYSVQLKKWIADVCL